MPNDGTSVENEALCPDGYSAIGGSVAVSDSNGDIVTSGIAVTESAIDPDGGWFGAVQDTDHSSDRTLLVTAQCLKPSSTSGLSRLHGR